MWPATSACERSCLSFEYPEMQHTRHPGRSNSASVILSSPIEEVADRPMLDPSSRQNRLVSVADA